MLHDGKLNEMTIRASAIVLLCSVLLVLFVPAGAGPFSAVHGPATALRANRAARVFFFHLALSARNPVTTLMFPLIVASPAVSSFRLLVVDGADPVSALRC